MDINNIRFVGLSNIDHLGNVRCSFTSDANGDALLLQENHYYPFGLTMQGIGSSTTGLENNFLYQGKERQAEAMDTDGNGTADKRFMWYDFSARYYDPQLGHCHREIKFLDNLYNL